MTVGEGAQGDGDVEDNVIVKTITVAFYSVMFILFECNKRDSYKKVEVARSGDLTSSAPPH